MDTKTRPVYMLPTSNPSETSRHMLTKLTEIKHKERILKAVREKQQVTYKGKPIQLTADLSAKTAGQKGMAGYI